MRVKKFEAKSMKEALLMVKLELGPDAVILSAKDHRKSYGLVGEGSVEVTAAVSESTLHKKKFVESRMNATDRERFQSSTARSQKQVIERMADRRLQQAQQQQTAADRAAEGPKAPRSLTRTSYIDIVDDDGTSPSNSPAFTSSSAQARVASNVVNAANVAAAMGFSAQQVQSYEQKPQQQRNGQQQQSQATPAARSGGAQGDPQISELRSEIMRLQEVIQSFQKMPQTFVSSYPGAEHGIAKELSFMFQKLSEAGVSSDLCIDILRRCQTELGPDYVQRRTAVDAWVARYILDTTQLTHDPYQGRMHVFLGPAGAGKTSSLVKMASNLVVNERKRIAIVATDTMKVGAVEQMKIYARILNVPFAIINGQNEWEWVMSQLSNVDHILVDGPGTSLKELEEIHALKNILPPTSANSVNHLVLRTTGKDSDAFELARRYKSVGYQDVIFTSLDQSVQHGLIYNFQAKTGTPLHSFGIGTRLPEDFEVATKERVLDLIFKLTKLKAAAAQERTLQGA